MSKYKELLEQIENADLKKALDEEISAINRDKGEYGRKLMEKDTDIAQLKEKVKETASYSEAFKVLKDKGVDLKTIPVLLEKLKVTKTLEDDLFLATQAVRERDTELADLRSFKKQVVVKTAVGKYLAEELANFKDESGKQIKVLERFIPEEKLYADIDVTNEVLIRERVKSVLKDGLQAQEAVRKEFGFQGSPLHTIPEAEGGIGGGSNAAAQLKEIAQKEGLGAAMTEYLKISKG